MFHIVESNEGIQTVVSLAQVIWNEHYTPIIGSEQVDYMLASFHSKQAIHEQIHLEGYQYYLIYADVNTVSEAVGYIGFKIETNTLFLSKLYVLSSQRGSGIGKQAMEFIKKLASEHEAQSIQLTVNKDNSDSIAAYYKFGFNKIEEICVDIGEGYVMDDFRMEMLLN